MCARARARVCQGVCVYIHIGGGGVHLSICLFVRRLSLCVCMYQQLYDEVTNSLFPWDGRMGNRRRPGRKKHQTINIRFMIDDISQGGHFGAPLRYITYNGRALPAGLSDPPALTDSETETWPADNDIDGEPPDYTGGISPSYRSSCLSER